MAQLSKCHQICVSACLSYIQARCFHFHCSGHNGFWSGNYIFAAISVAKTKERVTSLSIVWDAWSLHGLRGNYTTTSRRWWYSSMQKFVCSLWRVNKVTNGRFLIRDKAVSVTQNRAPIKLSNQQCSVNSGQWYSRVKINTSFRRHKDGRGSGRVAALR